MWSELKKILAGWKRRHRFNHAVYWGLRGLAAGLGTGLIAIFILLPRHLVNGIEYIEWTYLSAQAGLLLGFLGGFAWPINEIRLIRWFDQTFNLQERVSTAVEVQRIVTRNLAGKEVLMMGWRERQLYDTVETAKKVKPGKLDPFHWERPMLLLVYALGFLIVVFWIYAQPQFQVVDNERLATLYLKSEMERIQFALNNIKQAKNLTEAQKTQLLQPYNDAANRLQGSPSPQQVITALNQAEQQYRAMSSPPSTRLVQVIQSMGQTLGRTNQSPFGRIGINLTGGDLVQAGQEMQAMDFSKMTAEQRKAAVSELNQVGQSLTVSNPQLSKEMLASAIAIQQGNYQSAQQFIQDIGRTVETTGNQVTESQVAQKAANDLRQHQDIVKQQSVQIMPGKQKTAVALQNPSPSSSSENATPAAAAPVASGANDASSESVFAPQQSGTQTPQLNNGQGSQGNAITGTDQVPYIEVLPSYSDAYHKGVQNGDVPAYLQPVVRDYFSSLAP